MIEVSADVGLEHVATLLGHGVTVKSHRRRKIQPGGHGFNRTPIYPMGDVVQTVERWEPPDNFAGLGNAICNTIIDEIDAGLPNGRRYSDANNATERAAWKVIVKRLERTEKQARAMITVWVKNEVLLKEDYEDPAERKTLKGLRANPVKRPGREVRY